MSGTANRNGVRAGLMVAMSVGVALAVGVGCEDGAKANGDAVADVGDTASGGDESAADATPGDGTTQPDQTGTPDTPVAPDADVASDSAAADVTKPDAVVTGPLCPSVADCVFETCADAAGVAVAPCVTTALVTCTAHDATETAAAAALVQCANANTCPFGLTVASHYTCLRLSCLDEAAACLAPAADGSSACAFIGGCLAGCFDSPGAVDVPCHRACLEDVAPATVKVYLDLDLCTEARCVGTPDDEVAGCKSKAASDGLSCVNEYDHCFGNVGAAPGAAGGGSSD
jgi:hypothetical protein